MLKAINKIIFTFLGLSLFLTWPGISFGSSLNLYFFYGLGCPHCAKAEKFLDTEILSQHPNLKINRYEVYSHIQNSQLLSRVADKLQVKVGGVPFLVIGDKAFVGFAEGISDLGIKQQVEFCLINTCPDVVAPLLTDSIKKPASSGPASIMATGTKPIILPIIGQVDALSFSLPLLTGVMGLLDGFNPCAMWALIFLITLLLDVNDRKRIWLLGLAFIVTSAVVYFLFMTAWLNLILLLGFIVYLRWAIGLLAIGGGVYSLKDYFKKKQNVCEVAGGNQQQKFFAKMRALVQQHNLWLALGGIIVLATAINLVEMICSAGLPAVYTQVLALNHLPTWQYYAYLLLYIFFFMLDDLIVFAVAVTTLKMTKFSDKYSRASRLVGGAIMLLIGLLLIFKPELLMFG